MIPEGGPLERSDRIPTLERGNEKTALSRQTFTSL